MVIRIDEYGHIIRDNGSVSNNHTGSTQNRNAGHLIVPGGASAFRNGVEVNTISRAYAPILETSTPWYENDKAFWWITMIFSFIAAFTISLSFTPQLGISASGNKADVMDSIAIIYEAIAPYVLFLATIGGSVFYNLVLSKKFSDRRHTTRDYILSPLSGIAGALIIGLLLYLLVALAFVLFGFGILILLFGMGGGER